MSRLLLAERGYSLIEMLTVLVIMGVVMTSLTTVFVQASNSETDMNNRFQAQLDRQARARQGAPGGALRERGDPDGRLAPR